MAKKNLASLMSGLMGDQTSDTNGQVSELDQTSEQALSTSKPKRGRPRKSETNTSGSNEIRATFIVDSELVRKMKYISLAEDRMLKDVMSDALTSYVGWWESKNGEINLPKVD